MPSLPSSTNNENVRCGNSCADSITEAEKSRILEQVLHRQIILGVESIFSSILAGRNPKNISFHHVLNRIMMILQLQVNFAVFKKTKENLLQLMYLSNTDYKHRQKIGKYVQDTLQQKGQNIAINDTVKVWKELDELIYPILGSKTDYFLGVLKCEKLRSGSYEFEWVYKIENIVDVQNGWDCAGYKLARILDFENYKHTGELFLSSIKTALDRYINPLTDDQECFDKTNYTRNSESFWLDICNQDGRLKKEVLQSFNQLKDNFYTRLITDYTGGYGIIGKSVVDNIYNKAVPNINVVGNNSDLSNFFFITRSYSHKNYRRYERKITDETTGKKLTESYYDYNVRVAIPRSQRNDFKNFFCNLLSNKNNESTKNNSGIQL